MSREDLLAGFLRMEAERGDLAAGLMSPEGERLWPFVRSAFFLHVTPDGDFGDAFQGVMPSIVRLEPDPALIRALAEHPAGGILILSEMILHSEIRGGLLHDPARDPVIRELEGAGAHVIKLLYDGFLPPGARFRHPPLPLLRRVADRRPWPLPQGQPVAGLDGYRRASRKSGLPDVPWNGIIDEWLATRAWAAFWREILEALRPILVVMGYWCTRRNMGLAMACRELGISSADWQHGQQTWPHMGYHFPALPPEGEPVMPEWFLTWDAISARRLERCLAGQSFHRSIVAGKPAFVDWRRGLNQDAEAESRLDARLEGRIPVGVALPLARGEGEERYDALLEAAVAQSPSEWLWILRHHPTLKLPWARCEALPARLPDRTEAHLADGISLHAFLDRCRHLVVGASSVADEAELFHGLSVTCIHPAARFHMREPLRLGSMSYAATADDILRDVAARLEHPRARRAAPPDGDAMFSALSAVLEHARRRGGGGPGE